MKLTGRKCQCPTCFECFKSEAAFNKHRVGKIEKRRCLSLKAMEKRGMLVRDGFWILGADSRFV
jgi:hypothetical protein